MIKIVNRTLFVTNLLKEGSLIEMRDLGALHKSWQEKAETQREAIKKLMKTNWESYWKYLVKSHRQMMTLNCSLHSTQRMLPPLTDTIFTGQLRTHFAAPPQLKPMTNICDLRDKMVDIKSSSQFCSSSHYLFLELVNQLGGRLFETSSNFCIIYFFIALKIIFILFSCIQRRVQKFIKTICKKYTFLSL